MAAINSTSWGCVLETLEPPALGPGRRPGVLGESQLAEVLERMPDFTRLKVQDAELVRALALLWHDHLDAAHKIVQDLEDADGSFIHAIMHRREPDAWNSKYWWRRVGSHPAFPEMARRAAELIAESSAEDLPRRLLPGGRWDAAAFVDACAAAMDLSPSDPPVPLLRALQRIEAEVLLAHIVARIK